MELSYFEQCLIQDCIFEHVTFKLAEMENCTFKNCQFIDCRLHKLQCEKTTFNKCKFLESSLDNAIFESCYFLKSSFEGMRGGRIGSAVLTDSKFSNSNTSIKFEGDVYFNDIFDQIDKLYIN